MNVSTEYYTHVAIATNNALKSDLQRNNLVDVTLEVIGGDANGDSERSRSRNYM